MKDAQLPSKPSPDFPLSAHRNGQWAKKIGGRNGKTFYFGPWDDPEGALARYLLHINGTAAPKPAAKIEKPKPPSDDFPLFAHQNGQWAKTVRGKTHYFGPWAEPAQALVKWLRVKDALLHGLPVPAERPAATLEQVTRAYLETKMSLLESREIAQKTYDDYERDCERLLTHFGPKRIVEQLSPPDFKELRKFLRTPTPQKQVNGRGAIRKPLGSVALKNAIMATRSIFKYAFEQELIPRPIKYGQDFNCPKAKVLRIERASKPKKMFEAADIRAMLELATGALKPMILLGMNCGLGNNDCAMLEFRHLDLSKQWIDFSRPKTGMIRFSPLWPETCAALETYLRRRPQPKNTLHENYIFITQKKHTPWTNIKGYDPIGAAFSKLARTLEIAVPGVGFYALRHTFQTIAEEARDQKAVQFIMGHIPEGGDMSARYREEFKRDRLMVTTEYVRRWLFAEAEQDSPAVVPMVSASPPDSSAVA